MKIVIPVNLVPDLVEELTVDQTGAALDLTWARLILNELDDHAIEQGLLLKERFGGEVTVLVPDKEGADDVLFIASAKGADRLVKLSGELGPGFNNHAYARILGSVLEELAPDLILTGVQAHNDLDGQVGPLLAGILGFPYIGYVAGVNMSNGTVSVYKEYPGGLTAELSVRLPAVLGIQAADQPLRYVAYSRVRAAMQSAEIEVQEIGSPDSSGGAPLTRMYPPVVSERATMIEGDPSEIAAHLVRILDDSGVL